MNVIIEIYIFVCLMLFVFNLTFLATKEAKGHKYHPKYNRFEEKIAVEILKFKETQTLSAKFISYLTVDIKKTKHLMALQTRIQDDNEVSLAVRPYIFKLFKTYAEKTDHEQAFYTYVISAMDYTTDNIEPVFSENFINFLDTKSLYTFANTVDAIYQFGEVNLMIIAIDKMNERDGFYHNKLFVDGLLRFKGDFKELSATIIPRWHQYTSRTQENLIDFFRFKNIDVTDLCIALLEDGNTGNQLKYSVMRYFGKRPTEQSKQIFLDMLDREDTAWVAQLLAVQGLGQYGDCVVRQAIKGKITDKNWHVRSSAASYLYQQNISQSEIVDILNLKDNDANETMLYLYRNDEMIVEYITHYISEQAREQLPLEALLA